MKNYKNLFFDICDSIFGKGIIYIAFIITFILFTAQIGMISDYFRPFLSHIDVFEGQSIKEVDSLIKQGTISLQLTNMSTDKDIKILVNGIEVSDFSNNIQDITVFHNSIVEIDGSTLMSPVKVRVINKSKNIKSEILDCEVTTQSNIKILCRIKIE